MNDNLKTGLLILVTVLTAVNTFLLISGGNKNKETIVNDPLVSGASISPNSTLTPPTADPHADHANEPPVPSGPPTNVQFAAMTHDFGKVKQDTKNKHVFKFTNTGSNPLIINNATGSCGCTVPKYPKEPIPPGGTGEIEVEYSPGKQQGMQNKTVTVTANTEPAQTTLTITANVEEEK